MGEWIWTSRLSEEQKFCSTLELVAGYNTSPTGQCVVQAKKNLGMEQEAATVNAKKAFWSSSLQNKTQWQLQNQLLENTLFILFFSIKTVIHKI